MHVLNTISTKLWFHIAAPIVIALLINGLVFTFGWDGTRNPANPFLPQPWFIGTLWVIWLGFMGWARFLALRTETEAGKKAALWVLILMAYCLAYPFYALAPETQLGIMIGNIGSVFLTAYVFYRLLPVSKKAAYLIFPIILWVVYATIASAY